MRHCKWCGKPHNNWSDYCSEKCRIEEEEARRKGYDVGDNNNSTKGCVKGCSSIFVGMFVLMFFFVISNMENDNNETNSITENTSNLPIESSEHNTISETYTSDNDIETSVIHEDDSPSPSHLETDNEHLSNDDNSNTTESNNDTDTPTEQQEIYTVVDQMPKFPSGDKELLEYISKNIKYPRDAWYDDIQGRVIVQVVITKTGEIGDAKVVRSVHPDLDKEALRVIKSLPDFIPGRKNDQPVDVWYTIPVTFKI